MSTKSETIDEISDMLDSLSTSEYLRILSKLNTGDLLTLSIAIRKYGEEVEAKVRAELEQEQE